MSLMAQVAENAERLAEGQEERRAHKQALENLDKEVKGVQRKSEEQDGNIGDNTEASQEAKKLAEENKEKLEMLSLAVQMLKEVSAGGGGGSDEGVGNDAEKGSTQIASRYIFLFVAGRRSIRNDHRGHPLGPLRAAVGAVFALLRRVRAGDRGGSLGPRRDAGHGQGRLRREGGGGGAR